MDHHALNIAHLAQTCRPILLECDEFESEQSWQAFCRTCELAPFADRLHETSSRAGRVDACIAYLRGQTLAAGRPALSVLIEALAARYHTHDARQQALLRVLAESTATPDGGAAPVAAAVVRTGANPFVYGAAVAPAHFYGRVEARAHVRHRIGAQSAQSVSLVGQRRSGKSSLLRYVRERPDEFCQPEQRALLVALDLQDARYHTPDGFMEGVRRGIRQASGIEVWQSAENGDAFAVADGLELVRASGRRLIVLIDEFERIGARLALFHDWGEAWRARVSEGLCALVVASTKPLRELYQACGLTSPFENVFSQVVLGAFEDDAWHALMAAGFGGAPPPDDLALLDDLVGRLPFYTQMAAALLWQYGAHDAVRREFDFQATPRFRELWDDLAAVERAALRQVVGVQSGVPAPAVLDALRRHGLVRADGRVWGSAFARFVREAAG